MAEIVYADDERNLRVVIGAHLRLQGHTVRFAADGREALELVGQSPPDLVILDLLMPGMSGRDACASLRADPDTAHLPVIALTAYDGLEQAQSDFDAVVAKPFRVESLRTCIDSLLARPAKLPTAVVS